MKVTPMQFVVFVSIIQLSFAYLLEPAVPQNDGLSQRKKLHLRIALMEYSSSVLFLKSLASSNSRQFGLSPLILDWISLRYKFDYTIVDVKNLSKIMEDKDPHQPDAIIYILSGAREVLTAITGPLDPRRRVLDFVHPFSYSKLSFIIPVPEASQHNINAIIKPFQFLVWIILALVAGAVMVVLQYLTHFLKTRKQNPAEEKNMVDEIRDIPVYMVSTLLNQGGYISCRLTSIRLVLGAWCLLTLVLVNVYNGTLISYVTAVKHATPLVESIEELANTPEIHLVVDKGQGPDSLFWTGQSGLFKALGDKLRAYPQSRCNSTKQCVDLVRSKPPQHVYVNSDLASLAVLQQQYRITGKCNLVIGGDLQKEFALVWGVVQGSPYLEEFNQGTLLLHQSGLLLLWEKQLKPDTRPCLRETHGYEISKNSKNARARLTLPNLTGAFVVLAVGGLISFLAFLMENMVNLIY